MSLLDKATIITTPTAHSNGVLHSIKGGTVADFDVVRGSAATRVNAEGLIEGVATNIPRIDYTSGSPVLLVEPQSTNLVVNSGLNNVENIVVSATSHTISFYGTGSITLSGVHTATLTGTGASDRVSLTFTPSAGVLICTDSGSVDKKQVEALQYATSYVPTSGAIATRLEDEVTGAGDASTFNSTEGVLYVECARDSNDGNTGGIQINSGSFDNSLRLFFNQSDTISVITRVGGTNNIVKTAQAITSSTAMNKFALVWKLNDYKMYYNGSVLWSDTTAPVYPVGTLNNLDLTSQTIPFNGTIKDLRVYPTALTDAELLTLTTL
jgi:hypothetical protein